MDILVKQKEKLKKIKQERDKKNIGKRYLVNYNDLIPSFNRIAKEENEEVVENTILEYCGNGIYKDLITNNIVADSYNYNISEEIDFQFDLFNISKYIKEISKKESEKILEKITDSDKEKINDIIIEARINALNNLLEEIKEDEVEIEKNKVKSLQK